MLGGEPAADTRATPPSAPVAADGPDGVEARFRATTALMLAEDFEAARAELEQLRELAPELPAIHYRLGYVQRQMGGIAEALDSYRRALALQPGNADAHSELLLTLNYSAAHGAEEVFEEHRRYGDRHVQPAASPAPDPAWPRRLRIGYLSPDFCSHVVSCFSLPVIARHNRARFEVHCYHAGLVNDAVTEGMRALADRWTPCAGMSDEQLVERIRADRIDILVDLAGHTAYHRLGVLARRAAPLQATWLGYPNTTGLRAVDYRITDARADPPGDADRLHVERLMRLPRLFLCYRPGPDITPAPPLPGTQPGQVTFGCFNNFQKLSDPFFDAVVKLLQAVPGSRLLLKAKPLKFQSVVARVRERFERAGIDAARVILRGWEQGVHDHLAAYGAVDIALDSFPYNGTTTTCEALWMGVPVVTLEGDRHAARVGSSLLHAVGLGELVARDAADYVRIAAALAGDRARLDALRVGMRERLRRSPLLDEAGFVADLERAYVGAWQARLLAGEDAAEDDEALEQLAKRCFESGEQPLLVERIGLALARRGPGARRHYLLGCALEDLGRNEEAMAQYRAALELKPEAATAAKAANNLGALLEIEGRLDEAGQQYEVAVREDPALSQALLNLANLHKRLGHPANALPWLHKALEADPRNPELLCSVAECHVVSWKLDEAEAACREALAIAPQNARVHFGLGNALQGLGRTPEAEQHFREALRLLPGLGEARMNLLLCLHYHRGDDPEALLAEHLEWDRRHGRSIPRLPPPAPVPVGAAPRRLRIGYVSPNFQQHSVAHFLEPLLLEHDRSRFRIVGYANVVTPDKKTRRLRELCDGWCDISGLTDEQAARRIRADGIDILVDLAGHTGGGRLGIFARKPAPVQATWLGYPNTTGLEAVDWRITDARADPPGDSDRHCTEKLYRLERGFLCYSPTPDAPPVAAAPFLANGHVTYGSFNNLAKVGTEILALWARVLAQQAGSRMVIKAPGLGNASAQRELLAFFATRGVEAGRLTLLGVEPLPQGHLARYHEVDIALDTFPYHGTTTTCESLWMGVPVVTLAGRAHVSRVGASLLHMVGLDELVASSADEYVARAVALARDPARLQALRAGMRARMSASGLMDAPGFARALESAYREMWQRHAPGAAQVLAPESDGALRLHIGGRERRDGWRILNIQAGPDVDYVGDCADLSRFADGSVAEIYASHVLEHLPYREQLPKALAEFHRVLRPGGRLLASVPDFETLCRLFLASGDVMERFRLMRMAFGGEMDQHDFHHVGLSYDILSRYLQSVGFAEVQRVERFGLFVDASEVVAGDTLISLNVIARK